MSGEPLRVVQCHPCFGANRWHMSKVLATCRMCQQVGHLWCTDGGDGEAEGLATTHTNHEGTWQQ